MESISLASLECSEQSDSHPLILDGRNIYNREELEAMGFVYEGIGQ